MRFLVIRFSSLGDVVLATAAVNFIQAVEPTAEVTFLTKAVYGPLLEGHPALHAVWQFQGGMTALIKRIRAARFDGILDLQGKIHSRVIAAFSGSRSVRMNNHAWNRRLRVWLRGSAMASPEDVALRTVRAAAELLGRPMTRIMPSLSVQPAALAWADKFLQDAGLVSGEKIVAISPGAAWATKRWNPGSFAQALGLLSQSGRRFLFVGDSIDAALAQRIISYARRGADRAMVAAGKTDFSQLAALLSRSEVLLCNDSGPMHVASALGIPVLALFGPTVEAFGFFPRGPQDRVLQRELNCRPCSVHGGDHCPLGTHECMEKIAPFEVARALEGILNP